MAEFTEDNIAWPVMVKLAACIEEALEKRGLPGVCRSIPVPGPLAVMEACGQCSGENGCGGQAWVRLVNEFPYTTFPNPDQTGGTCGMNRAMVLEVGIARCLHVGKRSAIGGFEPPSVADLIADTRLQMADKAAMADAIACCVGADNDLYDPDYVLGQYQAMQTPGDCGGGYWLVTIG